MGFGHPGKSSIYQKMLPTCETKETATSEESKARTPHNIKSTTPETAVKILQALYYIICISFCGSFFAISSLGSVKFKTPASYLATTCSRSTFSGILNERLKEL